MKQTEVHVPWKLGLPVKFISCFSRAPPPASMELGCQDLTRFSGTWQVSFFSFRHLTTSATKLLHVIAMTKEEKMIRSATQDGLFSSEALEALTFWLGINMWLKHIRKARNTIDESPAMAAITRKDSSPCIA